MESCWSASRALLSMWIQSSALGCFTSLAEGAADNSNRYLSAFHLSASLPALLREHFSISADKSDTVSLEFVIKTCSAFYCCTNSENLNQKSVSYSPPSSFPASLFPCDLLPVFYPVSLYLFDRGHADDYGHWMRCAHTAHKYTHGYVLSLGYSTGLPHKGP